MKDNFVYTLFNKRKYNFFKIILILIQQLLIIIYIYIYYNKEYKTQTILNNNIKFNISLLNRKLLNYDKENFIIIKNPCKTCGLFSYYKIYISCILKFIIKGYIPIIDLVSFNNILNGFKADSSRQGINPWEYFFNQPFGYTLKNVINKGKNIYYFKCKREDYTPHYYDFFNKNPKIDFWHFIANKYIPINRAIIKESNFIRNQLFKGNNNILGILVRGTDYIALKPRGHPIAPSYKRIIKDINKMNSIYKYDYYFITTEDDNIRAKFINNYKGKIKYYYKEKIKYNYHKNNYNNFLGFNKNIKGNINYMKIYLINIIILSKCIDMIGARTNGSIGAFILTNGFRNSFIYSLGRYSKK